MLEPETRELQWTPIICDIFPSMFYCVQVLYTTNQQTSVFRDILNESDALKKNLVNSDCFSFCAYGGLDKESFVEKRELKDCTNWLKAYD